MLPQDLASWIAAPWAAHRRSLDAFLRSVAAIPRAEIFDATDSAGADARPPLSRLEGDCAVVPLAGMFLANPPAWLHRYMEHVPTRAVAAEVRRLAADPAVRSIRLDIDSPGGQVSGTEELAHAVAAARASKAVEARIAGMVASAAYWVAAQATRIVAVNSTDEIGSIGVYTVMADSSAFWLSEGIDWVLVSSGGVKGHGADGRVTQPLRDAEQRIIDGLAAQFRAAVARGRGRDLSHLATGETWLADTAVLLGLIDASPAHPQGAPMDLATVNQLVAANPKHALAINEMAAAGKEEAAIKTAIADLDRAAELAAVQGKLAAAEQQLAAQATQHQTALAAKDATIAAKDTEIERLKKLASVAGGAHGDVGGGEGERGALRRSLMSRKEKAAYVTAHGQDAYEKLPY